MCRGWALGQGYCLVALGHMGMGMGMGMGIHRVLSPALPWCHVVLRGCAGRIFGLMGHPEAATAVAKARVKRLCGADAVYSNSGSYRGMGSMRNRRGYPLGHIATRYSHTHAHSPA